MLEAETFYYDNRRTNYLVRHRVPSRVHAQDPMLFDFDANARTFAGGFFGWSTLASKPPVEISKITAFANEARAEGLESVVLIGQGGSSQAAAVLTKLQAFYDDSVKFYVMDSVSPESVARILDACNPAKTIYIVSSKSGSTVEPTMLMRIAWKRACEALGEDEAGARFVAITDPGSDLERLARRDRWRAIFPGPVDVGGRYSALSVFGLLPAALVGIDLRRLIAEARRWEVLCSGDFIENPAVQLASFLYENQQAGRKYFSLITPEPGRVFGLWVEQLIAESLGKNGTGILPNIEIDASMLSVPRNDRCAITYAIHPDASFMSDIELIDKSIPVIHYAIPDIYRIACHFIMWEYATAFTAVLMHVNPFDQPDVQSTKSEVKRILSEDENVSVTAGCHQVAPDDPTVLEIELSPAVTDVAPANLDEALQKLFSSLKPGDYFSTNAFLPFYPQERRLPLEEIRHCMVAHLGAVSSLEIGPRFLHSTGQFHKGGPNDGVFLILSAKESIDIDVPEENYSLDTLVHAQACGDMAALSSKGRRALRLHLADDEPATLAHISARICAAACKVAASR